ncbi:uncharacterized protein LACBIDRAFT_335442 [Laccaria bicolor S238N-H82]|uniref:Predicted protein n=1 Tax=Laccaria bicolor (strain S238N-H82 / ATCC MYA-4686) TaxID=486041 RepID=B0E2C4_LACBS|nr:uncharacterized protein LACBIDRAFT_335442 [Laccaria bicolor S238N-H82]EDQ99008.1 predicted protein [Laccaria bicolor S238N-H82]|eukprot:XP_001890345.1 predicted protein [Laccaria bicolor S238N-H82]
MALLPRLPPSSTMTLPFPTTSPTAPSPTLVINHPQLSSTANAVHTNDNGNNVAVPRHKPHQLLDNDVSSPDGEASTTQQHKTAMAQQQPYTMENTMRNEQRHGPPTNSNDGPAQPPTNGDNSLAPPPNHIETDDADDTTQQHNNDNQHHDNVSTTRTTQQ